MSYRPRFKFSAGHLPENAAGWRVWGDSRSRAAFPSQVARLSPHKTAQSQLETGGQDTQALAAGPESINQGRALSHVHNWCEK